jgi:hypothetical protein
MAGENETKQIQHEPPPFFGSWRTFYAVVLAELSVLVVAFYLFTNYFR